MVFKYAKYECTNKAQKMCVNYSKRQYSFPFDVMTHDLNKKHTGFGYLD